MAVEDEDGQAHVVLGVLLVQAELLVEVPDRATGVGMNCCHCPAPDLPGAEDLVPRELRHLVAQVPLEVLALQRLPELQPLAHVPEVADIVRQLAARLAEAVVVEVLEVVHPDRGHPLVVILGKLHLRGPLVWTEHK